MRHHLLYTKVEYHNSYYSTLTIIALDRDTRKKLSRLLSSVLQDYCADLNTFLGTATLQAFANKLCEGGIITTELRNNPVYNTIESQFTAKLNILTTTEDFETHCKVFLNALRSQGGPLVHYADTIRSDWTNRIITELNMSINL